MNKLFKTLIAYYKLNKDTHIHIKYLERVSKNALVEPSNRAERDIEQMMNDAMIELINDEELGATPEQIAILSPMLRQKSAFHIAKELRKHPPYSFKYLWNKF